MIVTEIQIGIEIKATEIVIVNGSLVLHADIAREVAQPMRVIFSFVITKANMF